MYVQRKMELVTWHIYSDVFFRRIHSYMWHDVGYIRSYLLYDTHIDWFSCGVGVFHTCESDVWQWIIYTCSITQMCNCVSVLYCTHTCACVYTQNEYVHSYVHTCRYAHVYLERDRNNTYICISRARYKSYTYGMTHWWPHSHVWLDSDHTCDRKDHLLRWCL